jgi:hypothetical protein
MANEKQRRCYSKFYNPQEFIEKKTPMWKFLRKQTWAILPNATSSSSKS